jgi:hypothetical protein
MTTTTAPADSAEDIRDVPAVAPVSPALDQDTGDRPGPFDNDVPVHPPATAPTVPDRPGPFDNDVPVHRGRDSADVPGRPGTAGPVDNDVPVRPARRRRTARARTGPGKPQLAAVSGDDIGTSAVVAARGEDNPSMLHDTALDGLSKAGQVRYVFDTLGTPTSAQVEDWLTAHGVTIDPAYVRRVSRLERARRGLADTSDLPALTAEVLAELDQASGRADDDGDHGIDPGIDAAATMPYPVDIEPAGSLLANYLADPSTSDLAARVATAQARIPLQNAAALLEALSDAEIAAERELAEWERATDREIRRSSKAAQLADARREQATAEAIAKSESADARWLQRAVSARRRLMSPDARLAQLHRRSEMSSRALVAVVILGMIWSGINVQHNLVPSGNMGNPLYWISFGIEAMISIPLIVIMVAATTAARWGRELSRGKVVPVELALLTITVGLNAGPHFASGNNLATIAENAIAPVMVGVVIWLHAWVSGHYATLVMGSDAALSATTNGVRQ